MEPNDVEALYRFSPENPFPLLDEHLIFRQATKQHAKEADTFLGFAITAIENEVKSLRHSPELSPFETWAHLDPQIFLTPYLELRYLLSLLPLKTGESIADLGCAYARIPFILHYFYPTCHFYGLDCVPHRINESRRVGALHGLKNLHLECTDVSALSFGLPQAEHFFIYDTGTTSDVERIAQKLRARINEKNSRVKSLIARGARIGQALKTAHPWLPEPAHTNQNFSIYLF